MNELIFFIFTGGCGKNRFFNKLFFSELMGIADIQPISIR